MAVLRGVCLLLVGALLAGCLTNGAMNAPPSDTTSRIIPPWNGSKPPIFVTVPVDPNATAVAHTPARSIDEANLRFALKLFREIEAKDGAKNAFLSPFSISIALAMAANGARGETRDAMMRALELDGLDLTEANHEYRALFANLTVPDTNVTLDLGNSMWIDSHFAPAVNASYRKEIRDDYGGQESERDFGSRAAVDDINAWASRATQGRIPTVLDAIDPSEVLFLLDAIYFHADWATKFDANATRNQTFTRADGSTERVPMMHGSGERNGWAIENANFTMAGLAYKGGRVAMVAFLPPGNESFAAFVAGLDEEKIASAFDGGVQMGALVDMPKFTEKYHRDLGSDLSTLGMAIAFDPHRADFGNIAPNLAISRVLHDSFVAVDEKGTTAAAVTTVSVTTLCVCGSTPIHVVLDRPFVYLLRDNSSGTILFMGAMTDPLVA